MVDSDDDLLRTIGRENENNNKEYVKYLFETHTNLQDTIYITYENIEEMKLGGTIYYVNDLGEVRLGGLLIKILNYIPEIKNPLLSTVIENQANIITNIKLVLKVYSTYHSIVFSDHFIFYKPRDTIKNKLIREFIKNYQK